MYRVRLNNARKCSSEIFTKSGVAAILTDNTGAAAGEAFSAAAAAAVAGGVTVTAGGVMPWSVVAEPVAANATSSANSTANGFLARFSMFFDLRYRGSTATNERDGDSRTGEKDQQGLRTMRGNDGQRFTVTV